TCDEPTMWVMLPELPGSKHLFLTVRPLLFGADLSIAPRGDRAVLALPVDDDVDTLVEEADAVANGDRVVQRFVIGPGDVGGTGGQRVVTRAALVGAVGDRLAQVERRDDIVVG